MTTGSLVEAPVCYLATIHVLSVESQLTENLASLMQDAAQLAELKHQRRVCEELQGRNANLEVSLAEPGLRQLARWT